MIKLYAIINEHPEFKLQRYFDEKTSITLVLVANGDGKVVAVLNPRSIGKKIISVKQIDLNTLQQFIQKRSFYMEVNE